MLGGFQGLAHLAACLAEQTKVTADCMPSIHDTTCKPAAAQADQRSRERRALVAEMSTMASSSFDPAAVAHSRHLPVESAMPGTTLQLIPLSAFSGNGALYGAPRCPRCVRLSRKGPAECGAAECAERC